MTILPSWRIERVDTQWCQQILPQLSIEEKAGQLLFIRLPNRFQHARKLVADLQPGGVIFFPAELQKVAHYHNVLQGETKIPLLVGGSFERGLGARLQGATDLPAAMGLGASFSPSSAYLAAKITATEARALGIHCIFAPVLDLNSNPQNPIINVRAFGDEPNLVAQMATAWVNGARAGGAICTIKHFPGQGNTKVDTHNRLAKISGTEDELLKYELYPFVKLLQTGKVYAVMTAHIWMPALDKNRGPVTLSRKVITDWLKDRFKGIVITDAMDMGGVLQELPVEQAIIKAINAGCDFILMPPDPLKAKTAIIEAVKKGEISLSQLDTAVKNILALKTRLGLHRCRTVEISLVEKIVGSPEHLEKALQIARKTITLVFNKQQILPISPETRTAVIGMVNQRGQITIWRDKYDFGRHLRRISNKVSYLFMGDTINKTDAKKAIARVEAADILVLALYPRILIGKGFIRLQPEQFEFIKQLMQFKKPTVVISFGSPYILNELPPVNAYICAYGNADVVHQAAAEVLFGITNPTARLPVTINKQFKSGSGESF